MTAPPAPPFDLLQLYARFGARQKLELGDPLARAAFGVHVGEALERALNLPALLQGQRVEAMFEALTIALGGCKLIKAEDGGKIWPDQGYRVPDFRLVLNDGRQWLVEVKNVYRPEPSDQRRKLMTAAYRREMEAYAAATGAELKLAVYWARWSIWTLVSPSRLVGADDDLVLDMMSAMTVSELSALGDETVGTRAPLRLRLITDPKRTSSIDADGKIHGGFVRGHFFSEDRELVDADDKAMASIFMSYGQWSVNGPHPIFNGDRLEAVDFIATPEEASDQGFDMVGTLSRMFARYYAEHTLDHQTVVHLLAPPQPEIFAAFRREREAGKVLPLWRFRLQPNFEAFGGGNSDQKGVQSGEPEVGGSATLPVSTSSI